MSHFLHNQTFSVQDVRGVIFSVKRSKSNATSIKNRKYFKFGEVGLRSSQKKNQLLSNFEGLRHESSCLKNPMLKLLLIKNVVLNGMVGYQTNRSFTTASE